MKHVRKLRMDLGLNQIEFAELIGCSEPQLAMAESGRRNLPDASLNIVYQLSIPPEQPAVIPDSVFTLDELKILDKDQRTRQLKIDVLELVAAKLELKIVQAGNTIALVNAMKARDIPPEELLMEQLVILQRKAFEKQYRYRKEWFHGLIEIAGLRAANEKAVALRSLLSEPGIK